LGTARLALSRECKHDIETAIYLHAATETELAEREARCKELAKQQGLQVLTICQDLITAKEKDYRRALARLYLPPIPYDIIIVDDLTQFAETREQADEIIARFYEQHCYVLPVTEDDFKSLDQRLREKDKPGPEESEDL
jgi:vacuolar-type H+-ATPase subunit F/Vma7